MRKKDLEIHCPDCGSRLRIDRETGEILAHGEEKATDLGEIQGRMEAREKKSQEAFGAAMHAERDRKKELDDLFKKASDKTKGDPGEDRPDSSKDDRWR